MKKTLTLINSIVLAICVISPGFFNHANASLNEALSAVQSKISLTQAIDIAQKKTKGELVKVSFEQEDDYDNYGSAKKIYEVDTVKNNMIYEVEIDADTGEIVKFSQEKMDKDDIAEFKTMKQAKINIEEAMEIAVKNVNGQVIAAEFDIDRGKPVYEVEVVKGKNIYELTIDAVTGEVLKNKIDS